MRNSQRDEKVTGTPKTEHSWTSTHSGGGGGGGDGRVGGGAGGVLPELVEGALALHRINGTDPLSRATTPSGSSNKSRSLGTPGADPRCWGQLREIGLSGADAHLTR